MPKNLLFIHLDSVSSALLWQYHSELPTVWRLKNEGMYFSNCYAAGTSTVFAASSVALGSVAPLDHYPAYCGFGNRPLSSGGGLFEILRRDAGYHTACCSRIDSPDGALRFYRNALPGCESYLHIRGPEPRDGSLERVFREADGRPVAVYYAIAIDLVHDLINATMWEDADDPVEAQRAIMRRCDAAVAAVFRALDACGRREDTVSFVFGDHGICFFSREYGSHSAQAGIYVEAERSWVPLIIHNSAFGAGTNASVASLDDLRATAWGQLFPNLPCPDSGAIHQGVDLFRAARDYAFTQNKYALQNENARFAETSKAYAITDGSYRLTASTPNAEAGTGGLELYMDQGDPGNLADLMELLVLDESGRVVDFDPGFLTRVDGLYFFSMFNPSALVQLGKRVEVMRDRLRIRVREKEEAALKAPGAEPHRFAEEAFLTSAAMLRKRGRFGADRGYGKGMRWLAGLGRRVALFGAGDFARKTLPMLRAFGVDVVGCLDNNPLLHGQTLEDVVIHKPEQAAGIFPDALIVGCLRNVETNREVSTQCRELSLEYISFAADVFGLQLGRAGFFGDQTK